MNETELKKVVLKENLCKLEEVEILIKLIKYRSKRLDVCNKKDCSHEHMWNEIVQDMIRDRSKVQSNKERLELEKKELLRKGFRVRKVKKGWCDKK